MTEAISYTVDADGICTLVMDLPGEKMNVLGTILTAAFEAAFKRAFSDSAVKGIILTSAKPTFVAGADLKAMGGDTGSKMLSVAEVAERSFALSRMLRWIETSGKPVACAINGLALGGGLEMALAAHYRVVADNPKILLGLPESKVGLMPGGGGTQRLPRLIGLQAALALILEGRDVSPQEALKLGFVHAVVPGADLLSTAKRWLLDVGDPVQPWDKKGFKVPGGGNSLDPNFTRIFTGANVMVRANTYGNYPAQEKILSALYEGLPLPMDTALKLEIKYFAQLMVNPVSGNMIRTMFISKGTAESQAARPAGIEKFRFTKIGVVGAGTMGAGIALSAAKAGIDVVLIDRDIESAERGKAYSEKRLQRDLEKGRTTEEKAAAYLSRIHPATDYNALSDVQLAIETVFEDRQAKREVIAKIAAAIPADAFIASNTSALPITELSEYSARPERFIGMHFFSPVERMPLIEIIRGRKSDDRTWAGALDFAVTIRKTPITVNDGPGFFTTRFIGSFVTSSFEMLESGVKPALIENGARMVGMPMGALAISDSIGLDIAYKAALSQAKDAGVEPTLGITAKLVAEHGRHGFKNGKGFFDYGEGGEKRLWPGLADLLPVLEEQPGIEEVKKRILYAQLAEGARCFAEGVLIDVIDGDLGATFGVGFPAYLGGPFAAMDTIGLTSVVSECDRLASLYGKRFELPPLVREMARNGQTFYGQSAVKSPGLARAA